MRLISRATKEIIVKKALNRGSVKLRDIAIQNNVSYPSITKWVRQYKNNRLKTTTTVFASTSSSKSAKLEHIIATASLDEKAQHTQKYVSILKRFFAKDWPNTDIAH